MRCHLLFTVFAGITLCTLLLTSCSSSRKIVYFQDLEEGTSEEILNHLRVTVRPDDKISIIVKSKDSQLSDLFNLPIVSYRVGQGQLSSFTSQNQQVSSYTVGTDGCIDFPVLGKLHISGKTREEIASHIKSRLIADNLVKDPVVTVEFDNLRYSVLGEVNHPGQFSIDKDKITILDAISKAGDLTIYGRRDRVVVLREEAGRQVTYKMNLCSGYDLYASPAYYLHQNDVVYVEPNATKARQSTVNGNNIRSTSFWISLASLLTSIGILIFN